MYTLTLLLLCYYSFDEQQFHFDFEPDLMEKARQKIDRNKAALCTRFISLTEGNTFIKCMNLQGSKFATIEEVKNGFFQAVHLSAANGDYKKGSMLDTVGELIHKGPAGKSGQGLDCGEGGKCMVKLFFMVRHKEVKDLQKGEKHDGDLHFVKPGERKGVCFKYLFSIILGILLMLMSSLLYSL